MALHCNSTVKGFQLHATRFNHRCLKFNIAINHKIVLQVSVDMAIWYCDVDTIFLGHIFSSPEPKAHR